MATMAAILKIYFSLLLLNQKANWLQTWQEASKWLIDKKELKLFRSEIMAAMAAILEIYFAIQCNSKGQFIW